MIDNKARVKAHSVIFKVISVLCSLFTLSVMVEHLPIAYLEFHQLVFLIFSVISPLGIPGLSKPLLRGAKFSGFQLEKYLVLSISIPLVSGISLYTFLHQYIDFNLALCSFMFVFNFVSMSFWRDLCIGMGMSNISAKIDLLLEIINLVAVYVLIQYATDLTNSQICIIFVSSRLVCNITCMFLLFKKCRNGLRVSRNETVSVKEIKDSTIIYTSNELGNNVDRLILLYFLTAEDLVYVALSQKAPEIIKLLLNYIRKLYIKDFSDMDWNSDLHQKLLRISMFISALIITFGLIITMLINHLFFHRYFYEILALSCLGLISLSVGQFAQIKMTFVRSRENTKYLRNVGIISIFVRAVGALLFINIFGILGFGINLIVYRLSNVILANYVIMKMTGRTA